MNLFLCLWMTLSVSFGNCILIICEICISSRERKSKFVFVFKYVFVFAQAVILPAGGMICILWQLYLYHIRNLYSILCLYLYLRSVFAGGMIRILWQWSTPSWAQRSKDKWDRSTFPSMRSGYTRVTHLLKRRKKTG